MKKKIGTQAKRPLRVIVIGRNSRQASLSGFDLREPTVVIYLCVQNLMDLFGLDGFYVQIDICDILTRDL